MQFPDRGSFERDLERGRFKGPLASLASRAWASLAGARLARPLRVPSHARVIAVGGATLGGSWKTPLALACAARLAADGGRVAIVGHAYKADPGGPRFVDPRDPLEDVGDEALVCARAVSGSGAVRVAVGPTRQDAVDLALRHADQLVIDGALQLAPRRADLALLVVDGASPWGAGACPPRGDLRALPAALVAASDRVVAVGGPAALDAALARLGRPVDRAWATLLGARLAGTSAQDEDGELVSLGQLRRLRVGLWTSIARPSRVLDALAREGVVPHTVLAAADHASPSAVALQRARYAGVDVWVCTPKCRTHLGSDLGGRPVCVLDTHIEIEGPLAEAIEVAGASPLSRPRALP